MARLRQMERYNMIIVFLFFIFILTIFYLPSLNSRIVSKDPSKEVNLDENGLTLLKNSLFLNLNAEFMFKQFEEKSSLEKHE